jgi:serine/threonine protein kinase
MEPSFYNGKNIDAMTNQQLLKALQTTTKYHGMSQKQITEEIGGVSVYILRPELKKQIISNQDVKSSPVKTVKTPTISPSKLTNIISNTFLLYNLSLQDLLALYVSSTDIAQELDNTSVITLLNKKYNANIVADTFASWYRFYQSTLIDSKLSYLYKLEKHRYINIDVIDNLYNNKYDVIVKHIIILFDWLFEVCNQFKLTKIIFSYVCTLFLVFVTNKQQMITRNELQLYGCVCLHYASLYFEEYISDIDDYVYISNGAFDRDQFNAATKVVIDTLHGQMIYPSPSLFINQRIGLNDINDELINLVRLTSYMLKTCTYKPSLVAQTCIYLLTGKYDIYTLQEITPVCNIIMTSLNNIVKSSIKNAPVRAKQALKHIKYNCGTESVSLTVPLKYHEPWHLGAFDTLNKLGEGTYGKVHKVKRHECGKDYVIKKSTHIDEAVLEIGLLNLLKSSLYIINLCGYEYTHNYVDLVLPLMSGSLVDAKLDKNNYNKYFKQLLLGIRACHNRDIIHRDLKLENVVYDSTKDELNIIDFGISVPFQSFRVINNTEMANSLLYRPPECLLFDKFNYGQAIDIWAIGCILYYLMTHTYIITNINTITTLVDDIFTLLGSPNDSNWPGFSQLKKSINFKQYPRNTKVLQNKLAPFTDLILDCLTLDPSQRPTAEHLLIKYF